jgi:hypothetical protein
MDHLHLVYDDELLKLFWDSRSRYHIAEWQGPMESQKLKTAAYACVNSSRTRQSPRWMADVSRVVLNESTADQKWLVDEFYPRLARNGVRYVAFVVAASSMHQIPVKRMNSAFDAGTIEFAYHASRTAAATWLAGQIG